MTEEQRGARWYALGILFGYPICCIQSFLMMEHLGQPLRKLNGTGFIPCHRCNEEKTEEELVAAINLARQPDLPPFPNGEIKFSPR